ncbi:unnamed protein product [Microthlaspi erraticum]|uniref:START domain-containing protein n=1 Tax=Microthlaspi erraticum TaxID=1685480 RepID=A0A6D2LM73_9BRAS|nr:unnamed protein product [Microthlaspi erraticum]
MSSSRDDDSSSDDETSETTNNNQRMYHRHTNAQIQRLEAYFKECPHPDDEQRRQLGEELQTENMKIRRENEAILEALKTVTCPPCGGPRLGREERKISVRNLRAQNVYLKDEHEKLKAAVANNGGNSMLRADEIPFHNGQPSYASNPHFSYGSSSNSSRVLEAPSGSGEPYAREHMNVSQPPRPRQPLQLQHIRPLTQAEKLMMSEMAKQAVSEVMKLANLEGPMWINSSIDGRIVIDQGYYEKEFAKPSHLKNTTSVRVESSKDVVLIPVDAKDLVDMCFDLEKWARVFATIVNEAKTIHVLEEESIDLERPGFSKMMYEQLHILSPLVPPREFVILRRCQQMEDNSWVIADVSYHLQNVEFDSPTCSKRPSGCLIKGLPDGRSQVTWIEHVEVTDTVKTHRLYKDLMCGGSGYGARRWVVTLERMCERIAISSSPDFQTIDIGGVVKTREGRMSVMTLGERMTKNFAWVLKMSGKLDFSQLSETSNSGVRVSVRANTEAGQPPGLIVCAGSSLSLPLPPVQVYNLLKDVDIRHQWDVLCHGNPVAEVACLVTGSDRRNCVNILQPSSGASENAEMMIIQDSYIDALGGMMVYAPVDLNTAYAAISGQVDPDGIPILPSGFIISRDNRPSSAEPDCGPDHTLLTVAFQILVHGPTTHSGELNLEVSTATVNTLISSTVQRVKAMLNCNQ